MAKPKRRGSVYYGQVVVPTDLIEEVGAKTKEKSLGTKDPREAKRLQRAFEDHWDIVFDDIRSRRALTADDKADAVWQHYNRTLERDEQTRLQAPTSTDVDSATERAVERMQKEGVDIRDPLAVLDASLDAMVLQQHRTLDAQNRQAKLAAMRKHLAEGETALINHEVDDYLHRSKLLIDPLSPDRGDLARKMMRAEIEALERTLEHDQGNYGGSPKDPIVKPATGRTREVAAPGERLADLFEIYARENPNQVAADTLKQARRDVGVFIEHVGAGFPVHRLDKKAVREWKALLLQYPVKATETKAFADMTLSQIVRANEKEGKPTIKAATVNRYLSGLAAFCKWLKDHDYIAENPTAEMFLKKKRGRLEGSSKTPVFTPDQLNVVFRSPLFIGCLSAEKWCDLSKPGDVLIRDHLYWVPLIMLFSGARPAEIAQLAVGDVRERHGYWIMHITTEGDGDKRTKTEGSMRVVPVHSELIRLGFIDYQKQIKKAGHTQLFPDAERNDRGQMIADWSREFGRYLGRLKVREAKGRGLSLYSFRHGATDALRRAEFLDEQFGFLIGHTKASQTGQYGNLPQGMLRQRAELIEAIAYPGLDLEHLIPA